MNDLLEQGNRIARAVKTGDGAPSGAGAGCKTVSDIQLKEMQHG